MRSGLWVGVSCCNIKFFAEAQIICSPWHGLRGANVFCLTGSLAMATTCAQCLLVCVTKRAMGELTSMNSKKIYLPPLIPNIFSNVPESRYNGITIKRGSVFGEERFSNKKRANSVKIVQNIGLVNIPKWEKYPHRNPSSRRCMKIWLWNRICWVQQQERSYSMCIFQPADTENKLMQWRIGWCWPKAATVKQTYLKVGVGHKSNYKKIKYQNFQNQLYVSKLSIILVLIHVGISRKC